MLMHLASIGVAGRALDGDLLAARLLGALRLARAVADLRHQLGRLTEFYRTTPVTAALVDLFHGCTAAGLIAAAAQRNTVSIGCHYIEG